MIKSNHNLKRGFTFGGWLPYIIPELEKEYPLPALDIPNMTDLDNYLQFKAFLAGMQKNAIANPNPSVGCVIAKDGNILSTGCTDLWKGLHAEAEAFKKLDGQNIKGANVYVTLEPCTHFGNQPPCVNLFKNRGIGKIFISRPDLNPQVMHKSFGMLEKFGIKVLIGPLANEVTAWNYPFFIQQKYNRPMIALKWAQSLDGCLADDSYGSRWISGPISRKYTHWLRQKYDAILVGASTFLKDTPSLDVREIKPLLPRDPLRIIFDPKASIFKCSKDKQIMLKKKSFTKNTKTLFLIAENMIREVLSSSSEWCIELKTAAHIKILPIKSEFNFYSAKDVLESLNNFEFTQFLGRPLQSLLVEGGPRILSLFIEDELFDVAHVFTAPFVLGGRHNRLFSQTMKSFREFPSRETSSVTRWQLIAQERLGDDLLMEMTPYNRFADVF